MNFPFSNRLRLLLLALTVIVLKAPGLVADSGTLTIWINGDKGYAGIEKIGEKFTKDTGIQIKVEHPEDAIAKFEQAVAAGKGPDIWIWAHDRVGSWITAGLISAVTPSKATIDSIDPMAWSAWNIKSKTWGYPLSIEAIGLIYNKALVPTPPKNWQEVIQLDKKLATQSKRAILWSATEIYYSFGLISPGGGYAFKRNPDGTYDSQNTGIANPGSVKGIQTLVDLINAGVMPKKTLYFMLRYRPTV